MKREDDKRFHLICERPIIPFSSKIIGRDAKTLKINHSHHRENGT